MEATASDERLLLLLKTEGPTTAPALARRLSVTPQWLRRRLDTLRVEGYVAAEAAAPAGRAGRPSQRWSLTAAGHGRFPDAHDQMAVELIEGIRESLGEPALDKLIAAREATQRKRYAAALDPDATLHQRLKVLARQRSAEGYMAEVRKERDGSYLLIEHHCPICAAARACQGFCRSELAIFRAVLGPDVTVERTQHLLADGERCVYRVKG